MLFDIRGRRKHVVRVVYAILALLMGASLFLVVGPFNIGNLINGSSASNAAKVLDEQAERIEQKLVRNPDDEALLLSLTRTRIAAANALTEVDPQTGATVNTVESNRERERAVEAWNSYLKQAKEPSPSAALLVAGTYFGLAEGSGDLELVVANVNRAAETQRIAADAQPTINSLTTLAIYEYYAGNFAAGDKVAKQAEAKAATKSEKKEIGTQMAEYRKRGKAFENQKKEFAKAEKGQSKERLENPFGGLTGGSSIGE